MSLIGKNFPASPVPGGEGNLRYQRLDITGRPSTTLAKYIKRFETLHRMLGLKVTALFLASIPVGVILGVLEIVTASVLYAVLVEFELVPGATKSSGLSFGFAPVAALLLFTIVAGVLRYAAQLLPSFANHALNARLREALVRNILGGKTERSIMSVADASNVLSTLIPKSGDFVHALTTTAVGACLLLLILAGMVHMSWRLTAVVLVFVFTLGLVLTLTRQVYGRHIERMYALFAQFNTGFIRDARNNHLLRISGVNEEEADRLIKLSGDHIRSFRNYFILFAATSNIPSMAAIFLMVGVFWLNATMQFLSIEALIPLVYLLSRTGGSINGIATATGILRQNRPHISALATYVSELFPDKITPTGGAELPTGLFPLVVTGLRFGRGVALVPPISLSAGAGEAILISGASGKGKTTLLMTLVGFLEPLGGSISWGGMPIERIDPTRLRRRLGYAGPEPYLIDADIRANLLFGIESERVADVQIEQALRLACAEFVFDLDGGLAHRLREAGDGISAGQKQRLAIARCLLRRPDVLLLDEATGNIDEATERQIMEKVRTAFPSLLIIAVSHRASLRRFATVELEI